MISSRRFKPGLVPTLVTLILLPVFMRLGFWQLERADEKMVLQSSYEERAELPAFRLESRVQARDELEYRRVYVRGTFDSSHQVLIDNKVLNGKVGYYVISPLKMVGSNQYVLINRGWVPAATSRNELPDVEVTGSHVTIHGVLVKPRRDIFMISDQNRDSTGWPMRLQWLDVKEFVDETKFDVYPFALLMDADAPHGYTREWRGLNVEPEKNTGYAIQWFSFAALLIIIYIGVGFKKSHDEKSGTN